MTPLSPALFTVFTCWAELVPPYFSPYLEDIR